MTIAWVKKIFYECVFLTFATTFLIIAFVMALGYLIGVMSIAFALPIDLNKSL